MKTRHVIALVGIAILAGFLVTPSGAKNDDTTPAVATAAASSASSADLPSCCLPEQAPAGADGTVARVPVGPGPEFTRQAQALRDDLWAVEAELNALSGTQNADPARISELVTRARAIRGEITDLMYSASGTVPSPATPAGCDGFGTAGCTFAPQAQATEPAAAPALPSCCQ